MVVLTICINNYSIAELGKTCVLLKFIHSICLRWLDQFLSLSSTAGAQHSGIVDRVICFFKEILHGRGLIIDLYFQFKMVLIGQIGWESFPFLRKKDYRISS